MTGVGRRVAPPTVRRLTVRKGTILATSEARMRSLDGFARGGVAMGLAILVLGGCDDDGALTQVRAEIEVAPEAGTSHRFDEFVLGVDERAEPWIVEVSNIGDGVLDLTEVFVEGAGADQFRISSSPDRLPPQDMGEIFVRFEPTVTGTASAELVLRSNDQDEPELRWPLVGTARDPCRIDVTPQSTVFLLNQTKEVTIRSLTSHDCILTDIQTDRALFEIELPGAMPYRLAAGSEVNVPVRYFDTPLIEGRVVRQLIVREDEGSRATVNLEGEPPPSGCLEFFPDRLVYPVTNVGSTALDYVQVVNSGCDDVALVVDGQVTTGAGQFAVIGNFPLEVRPGELLNIPVEYYPLNATGDGGRAVFLTNDAALPSTVVNLFGTAADPMLEIFPRKVDFGTVAYRNPRGSPPRSECSSSSRIVQLYSVGAAPVVVSDIRIDGGSDPLFQIASVTVDGQPVDFSQPFQVPQNREMRIELVFAPSRMTPSLHEGTLIFEHNVGSGTSEVELVGYGADDGSAEDVFQQLPGPKADILWVIDDSCSMFDEQLQLITNLSEFTTIADGLGSDYQMGVVTTDGTSSQAGRFERCFPAPPIVGSDYGTPAERQTAFECMFNVGLNGSGQERGISAAKRALERALDENLSPNPNRGFLRDDANLAIVVVSDEDDSSAIQPQIAKEFFVSLKGRRNPERVRFHSIVFPTDTREGCEDTSFGTPGYRYRRLSREMNGLYFNICLDDWSPILQNLGIDTFTPLDGWELSREADPATLQVTVNGVPILEDEGDGWSYEPNYNAVRFNGTALPPAGAEVRIRYQGLCRP